MSIKTKEINYQINNDDFTGFLAFDDAITTQQTGVIIVHEWWGHDDYVRGRAEQLAQEGFVAFALDMYGTGKVGTNPDEAGALMNEALSTENAIEQRFGAALEILKNQPQVNAQDINAIGYCFGGAVVLNMARAGKLLKKVASFHGLLETESPMQTGVFSGEIAAFTGADDPMVSPEIVSAFEQEMNNANVTCALTSYPNVLHAFTNPAATARGEKFGFPLRYDAQADQDSYNAMIKMFKSNT